MTGWPEDHGLPERQDHGKNQPNLRYHPNRLDPLPLSMGASLSVQNLTYPGGLLPPIQATDRCGVCQGGHGGGAGLYWTRLQVCNTTGTYSGNTLLDFCKLDLQWKIAPSKKKNLFLLSTNTKISQQKIKSGGIFFI